MTTKTALGIVSAVWLAATPLATAASPTPGELAEARQWAAAKFEGNRETMATDSFFSFTYDGKPSAELLKTWECKRSNRRLDDKRTEHTIAYTDPKTGLIVRVVGIEYRDFPSVEWTLYCKNAGKTDTPIIENIRSLDIRWQRGEKGEFLLHHNVCAPADGADYTPLESVLGKNAKLRLGSCWRTFDEPPHVVLQFGAKQGRGAYRGDRLARTMGGRFYSRRRLRHSALCGSGTDAFQAVA